MLTVPDHILNVRTNLSQIVRLLDIHTHLTGAGPGRRREVQVLNKSAVLLLVATWEAYVEDLAISACRFAEKNGVKSTIDPCKIKKNYGVTLCRNGVKSTIAPCQIKCYIL